MIDPIRRLLTEAGNAKQTRAFWQAATAILSDWVGGARVHLVYKGLNESGTVQAGATAKGGEPFIADYHDAEGRHVRSEEHTSELQSPCNLVCRLLLEKKKT